MSPPPARNPNSYLNPSQPNNNSAASSASFQSSKTSSAASSAVPFNQQQHPQVFHSQHPNPMSYNGASNAAQNNAPGLFPQQGHHPQQFSIYQQPSREMANHPYPNPQFTSQIVCPTNPPIHNAQYQQILAAHMHHQQMQMGAFPRAHYGHMQINPHTGQPLLMQHLTQQQQQLQMFQAQVHNSRAQMNAHMHPVAHHPNYPMPHQMTAVNAQDSGQNQVQMHYQPFHTQNPNSSANSMNPTAPVYQHHQQQQQQQQQQATNVSIASSASSNHPENVASQHQNHYNSSTRSIAGSAASNASGYTDVASSASGSEVSMPPPVSTPSSSVAAVSVKPRMKIVIKDNISQEEIDLAKIVPQQNASEASQRNGAAATEGRQGAAPALTSSNQRSSKVEIKSPQVKSEPTDPPADSSNKGDTKSDKAQVVQNGFVEGSEVVPPVSDASANHHKDFSGIDYDKVKEFVPVKKEVSSCPNQEIKIYDFKLNKNSAHLLHQENKSGVDGVARTPPSKLEKSSSNGEGSGEVVPSPVVRTATDASCPNQEIKIYDFKLNKNSEAVLETQNEKIILKTSPTSTPLGESVDKHQVDAAVAESGTFALPQGEVRAPEKKAEEPKEGKDAKDLRETDKEKESARKISNGSSTTADMRKNSNASGTGSKPKDKSSSDEKYDSSSTQSFNTVGKSKSKKKRKEKEKEFEKKAETGLLSAYEAENQPQTSRAANQPQETTATVTKPSILPLTKEPSGGEAQSNGDAKKTTGPSPVEKQEEELSWEDKTLPDETPEEEKNKLSAHDSERSSNSRKIYDRDFLLSLQKNPTSLKKAPFTQDGEFRDIVTNQPQFLRPLSENNAAHDFRESYAGGGGYNGHGAMGGAGLVNDFTPEWHRRKPGAGPTNSRGKGMQGGPSGSMQGNMGGGPGGSYRGGRGSFNQPRTFSTNAQSQEIRLSESSDAWKAKRKLDLSAKSEPELKRDNIRRQTRAILNKLTPQNFSTLSKEMAQLDIDTDELVGEVIEIVFEKACLEPSFAEAYANMCKTVLSIRSGRLSQQQQNDRQTQQTDDSVDDPVIKHFRRYLLNKCQGEFQREKDYEKEYESKKKGIAESTETEKEKREKSENLEMEMRKSKKKSLGNIRFIGELFKLDFLTEKIMHSCIEQLLKAKDEDSLECLCKLLTTIGRKMDHPKAQELMDQYFKRMQQMVQMKQSSSRIRFMLQDVLDLRLNHWESKKDTAPKTIDQIHKDAQMEDFQINQKAQQLKMNKDRPPYNDKRYNTYNSNRINNNSGPTSQQEWQHQTVNSRPNSDVRALLSKTKTPALGGGTEVKLGGGSKNMWSKGSGGSSFTSSQSRGNMSGGPTSSQGSESGQKNRFNALDMNYGDEISTSSDSNRSSSADLRNPSKGPSDLERKQGRDEAIRSVQNLKSGGGIRGMSPASADPNAKFTYSSNARFSGPTGSSGSGAGGSRFNSRDRENKQSGATYPNQSRAGRSSKSLPPLTPEQLQNKANVVISEFMDSGDVNEYCQVVAEEVPEVSHAGFVKVCFDYALDRKDETRRETGRLLCELAKSGTISVANLVDGVTQTFASAVDLSYDIPMIWNYYGDLMAPSMVEQIPMSRLSEMVKCLIDEDIARELVAQVILKTAEITSQEFVSKAWNLACLTWKQFMPDHITDEEIAAFVEEKGLNFTLPSKSKPTDKLSAGEHELVEILKTQKPLPEVFSYIQNHLRDFVESPEFIEMLTRAVCKTCIKRDDSVKFVPELFDSRKDVLARYINHDELLMFHCLFSVQRLVTDLQHPPGLLNHIFNCLYDNEVVLSKAFTDWKNKSDPAFQLGKGTCVMETKTFFDYLEQDSETD